MTAIGNLKHIITALCLVALSAFHAQAAPSFTVLGEGTTYTVSGSDLNGINGIDLTLGYDTSSLSSPTVSPGSLVTGAMIVPNTTVSGSVRFAIISASKQFSGSGQIATISFASGKGGGGITSCQVNSLVDGSGKSISASCVVVGGSGSANSSTPGKPFEAPVITPSPDTTGTTTIAGTAATAPAGSPVNLGTLNPAAETPAKIDPLPVETPAPSAHPAEPLAAPAAVEPPVEEKKIVTPQKPREVKTISPKATLENFRTYQGEKSPAIFVALMTKEVSPTIHQDPAVALSDGKTTVKILVKLAANEESPNFALNGARMVTLGKDEATASWIIEALPQMNTLQATLTILAGSEIIEFPLTLAPPAPGISPEEILFSVFLKDSGVVPPKRDLNADGRHDYLDDFIYTANYLSQKGAAVSPKTR